MSLYSNKIGPEGAVALAESPHLSRLETLDLSFNKIGDEGVVMLEETIVKRRPAYREYIANTNAFIPGRPKHKVRTVETE